MTPLRKETRLPSSQPVRFYKIVALSFLVVTVLLLGMIIFMSSKRAMITITTKETPIDVNFSVTVGAEGGADQVAGRVASTTIAVADKFSPHGNKQEDGTAKGVIIIHNESNISQPLVATTRFLSANNILFRLKNSVVAPANGTVEAEVYADQKGAGGNIKPTKFTIPGLNETRQQVIFGTSEQTMAGGTRTIGVLSKEDIRQAEEKLLEMAKTEGEKKLAGEQGDLAGLFQVVDYSLAVDTEEGKEVSEFGATLSANVVGIFYNKEELGILAENSLMKQVVDDIETVETGDSQPVATFESFDKNNNQATLSVFYSGVSFLNSESKQLNKTMFFGKTRDEIRRYALSLDHVYSVDVKFSPAWMQTAPQVGDHVNVVVKNVR